MRNMKMKQCVLGVAAMAAVAAGAGKITVGQGGVTPHEAVAAIRAAKASGDKSAWTVRVKRGFHVITEPLVFLPEDSGAPKAPVTWIGEDGAVISGGAKISGWRDDGGGVWSAPIPDAPSGGKAYFEQLWVNGRRADRARIPNRNPKDRKAEYIKVKNPVNYSKDNKGETVREMKRGRGDESVVVTDPGAAAALAAASKAGELESAQMCLIYKWTSARRIVRRFDAATATVWTHGFLSNKQSSVFAWNERQTLVWFENVRAGFDAPGEWFYDAGAGRILYRPLPGEDMRKAEVVAPTSGISKLVVFKGEPDDGRSVHDIVFRNVAFEHTAYRNEDRSAAPRTPTQSYQYQAAQRADGAINGVGAERVTFEGCAVRHTGTYAMRFGDGCRNVAVRGCDLEDLGCGGVWIGAGKGYVAKGETLTRRVVKELAPRSVARCTVENCTIRGGGRFDPEGTGVVISHASDCKVLHCDIEDFYYSGVSVGWSWGYGGSVAQRNEIAWNRIRDLGKGVMSDLGGVYTLGTSFGTRVHHNVVSDVSGYSYGGWGLYADEGSEGIVFSDNLVYDTNDGGFHQHYGTGCVIRNNIFAWNRSVGAVRSMRREVSGIPSTFHFTGNVVVTRDAPLVGNGTGGKQPVRAIGGVWAGNTWFDYGGKPDFDGRGYEEWTAKGKEILGRYADPLFVDAEGRDFRLKPESPALAQGYRPWDFSAAGRTRQAAR